jgi:hypothetical protein
LCGGYAEAPGVRDHSARRHRPIFDEAAHRDLFNSDPFVGAGTAAMTAQEWPA